MKYALLSDIHGNSIALDAVTAHIEAEGGVDGWCFVGDYAGIGYDPIGVLERITRLQNAVYVRGNTERHVTSPDLPPPSHEDARKNPDLIPILAEVATGMAWTQGMITAAGWFDWVARLPLEHRFSLPDGSRVLLVHAAPGADEGEGIAPFHTDEQLRQRIDGSEADLIFVGHTHIPLDRSIDGIRLVNIGAISNPLMADLRASYVTLECDSSGYEIAFHRVDYDREAAVQAIHDVHHPAPDYLIDYMRGNNVKPSGSA